MCLHTVDQIARDSLRSASRVCSVHKLYNHTQEPRIQYTFFFWVLFFQGRLLLCLLLQKVYFLKWIGFTGFVFSKRCKYIPLTNVIANSTHIWRKKVSCKKCKLNICTQSPRRSQILRCLQSVESALCDPWPLFVHTQEQHGKMQFKSFLISSTSAA